MSQQVAGGKVTISISAQPGAINGLVKAMNHTGGQAGLRIEQAFCSMLRAHFAQADEFSDIADAAAQSLFRPGAAGGEQGGQGGQREKGDCVSHTFSIVDLSLRRNRRL